MQLIDDIGIRPIYEALKNDKYDRGAADYTPSSLNQPAYQRRMMDEYDSIENASEKIFALLGTSVHHMVELAAEFNDEYVSERRYYGTIETDYGDKKVGAQIDLYNTDTNAIYDMKVTSAYSAIKGEPKSDWVAQLNVCRWCVNADTGNLPESLTIVAILRDWSKLQALRDRSYPRQQVVKIPVPLWTLEKTRNWIRSRINLIERYRSQPLTDCAPCTDEEVWAKPTKWAVMKSGKTRAVKLYDNNDDAANHAKGEGNLYVEKRKGERVRCQAYCPVSQHCKFK